MSENTGTPALNEALAKLQAALPRVGKGETAKVPGKDGKQGYSYKYADLADVSQAVLPVLGKHGLSFRAKPTINATGAFVLAYKLAHVSGEADGGEYPLPSPDRAGPQQVGSAITYARRYCLCAVTGIHPDGEDDDAARAQSAPYSAGEAFENASTVRPAGSQPNGSPANGHVTRPPAQERPAPAGERDPDAQALADEATVALTLDALKAIHDKATGDGKMAATAADPDTGTLEVLGVLIERKRKHLKGVADALAELHRAAEAQKMPMEDLEIAVKHTTGKSIDDATAAELRQAANALKAAA